MFKAKDFSKFYEKAAEQMLDVIIDIYKQAGEQFIADARSNAPTWKRYEIRHGTPKANPLEKRVYKNGKVYRLEPAGGTGFMDWTANLRSSIGYAIFLDGELIFDSFPVEGGGQEGALAGKGLAVEVATEFPNGVLFVGTAGMNYAANVEAHSYDVITGSATLVQSRVQAQIKNLLKKFKYGN